MASAVDFEAIHDVLWCEIYVFGLTFILHFINFLTRCFDKVLSKLHLVQDVTDLCHIV